jgi:hypothetical protein
MSEVSDEKSCLKLKRFPRNPHWRYSGVFVDEASNEKDHFDV